MDHYGYVEEDKSDDTDDSQLSPSDRKRMAHASAERKRRDSLSKGYDDLQGLVPMSEINDALKTSGHKINKCTILHKSVDYIQYLTKEEKKQEDTLIQLRKEVQGLRIMKQNYEQIVQAHQAQQIGTAGGQIPDEVKFQVFRQIMDAMFNTFNSTVIFSNFSDLSAGIFRWLEEYWRPQALRDVVGRILPGRINLNHLI